MENQIQPKKKNLKAILIGLGILFLIGVMTTISEGNKSSNATPSPTANQNPVADKVVQSSTPSSSPDPCEQYSGTDLWSPCENQQSKQNKLNAKVQATVSSMIVTNLDNVDWTGCMYSIGADMDMKNAYQVNFLTDSNTTTIPAHQSLRIGWGLFTKDDGTRFSFLNTEPNDIDIYCDVSGVNRNWTNY